MAKATLLEPTIQVGGNFTTLSGVVLVLGVPTEISTHNAMLYMDSHNIKVDFEAEDFKDIQESVLENMSRKLDTTPAGVKGMVIPKTTITKKATEAVKSTLKRPKPKLESLTVKEATTTDEETLTEDPSSDE